MSDHMSGHPNEEACVIMAVCRATGFSSSNESLFVRFTGIGGGHVTRFLWPEEQRDLLPNEVSADQLLSMLEKRRASMCPRCGARFLFPEPDQLLNETSHYDRRILICIPCGTEEAIVQFRQKGVISADLPEAVREREQRMVALSIELGIPPTKEEA